MLFFHRCGKRACFFCKTTCFFILGSAVGCPMPIKDKKEIFGLRHLNKKGSKMNKRVLRLTTIFFLALFVQSIHAQEPVVMKFPHVANENTPKGQMAVKFKELVAKRLEGKVVVEIYPEGSLYGDNNVLEAMLLGDVQMAAPSVSKFGAYCKGMQVFDLPFLFADRTAVFRFQQSSEGRHLLESLAKKGFIGVGYLNDGLKVLSATRPLVAPADASGLRFRIQPSRVLEAQFYALDALPVKKPFPQLATLLQDNAIDGQENTWANIFTSKIFKAQPFITESNHGIVSFLVVVSAGFWQNLEKPVRLEIRRSLEEAIAFGNDLVESSSKRARQEIIASHAATIIPLSEFERALWEKAMKTVWRTFEQEMGRELIETAYQSH